MKPPVTVRGIGSGRPECSDFVTVYILIPGRLPERAGEPAVATLKHELHLVSGLRARVLVGMDILGAVLDFKNRCMTLPSCSGINIK